MEEADYLDDVEEAYWTEIQEDLEDVFGLALQPSPEALA